MADYKLIPLSEIIVPDRLRAVEEDHALAIQASIVEHGLLNPITVRATPASKGGNYTLVAGAHRLRAVELLDEPEIEAVIVSADKDEAVLIEVEENLFRNELSTLDRAIFVQTYRDVWERKYGKINPKGGRPTGNRINLIQLLEDEARGGFSQHAANRMGISEPSVKRLNQIAQNLHPQFRSALRGTPVADNQSELLKLSKLEPEQQRKAALAFSETGDIKQALRIVSDNPNPPKPDPQEEIFARLVSTWERASSETKARFLGHLREDEGDAA